MQQKNQQFNTISNVTNLEWFERCKLLSMLLSLCLCQKAQAAVSTDGKDGNWWKREKIGQFVQGLKHNFVQKFVMACSLYLNSFDLFASSFAPAEFWLNTEFYDSFHYASFFNFF